jgi:uncharacterized repeat protein (TIGR03803 family)
MKSQSKRIVALLSLAAAFLLSAQGRIFGQLPAAETVLHSLTADTDGSNPRGSLILASDGNYYGTTFSGGSGGGGTLYRYSPSGNFTLLYSFPTTAAYAPSANPIEAADGNLYGTLYSGGTAQYPGGGIYKYDMTTGQVTIVYNFQSGGYPISDLTDDGNGNLYGTAAADGVNGSGSVWTWNYKTNSYSTVYSFASSGCNLPESDVVLASDGLLYGSATSGGAGGAGCLFTLKTDGTGFADIYDFDFGNDGGEPLGGLTEASDGKIYGWSQAGNAYDNFGGTLYSITPNGAASTFELVYGFQDSDGYTPKFGRMPIGGDGNLYLAARFGGAHGKGEMMRFDLSGNKTTIYDFGASSTDASNPYSQAIEGPDGNLYGTSNTGGANGAGSLYMLATGLPPAMTLTPSLTSVTPNTNVTLTWTVNNAFSRSSQVCVARSTDLSWTGLVATTGTASVVPSDGTTIYSLTCGGFESVTATVTVSGVPLAIKTTSLPTGYENSAYQAPLSATGGKEPYTWSIRGGSGNLPGGITLNSTTGTLSGTPTQAGTFNFSVEVTDAQGDSVSIPLSILVRQPPPVITTTKLPYAAIGRPYTATLAATGAQPPYTWTVNGGALPVGLTLSSAGVISGTPTTSGTALFTVQVADSQTQPETATAALSIPVQLTSYAAVTASVTPSTANPGQNVTLTAGVFASTLTSLGAPTGSVQFQVSGNNVGSPLTLDSTGTVTLSNQSFQTTGTYQVTAVYSGDSIYAPLASPPASLLIASPSLTVSPANLGVNQKGTATATLATQYFASNSLNFSCSGLPMNAACSFSPVSSDGKATLTITTGNSPNASASVARATPLFGMPAMLGLVVLCFRRRSRALRVLLMLALTAPFALWISACGGSNDNLTPVGATAVTVTATAGSQSATAMVQLTVNKGTGSEQ